MLAGGVSAFFFQSSLGFRNVCMWLGSYLSGRVQKIRMGDAISMVIKVTSGVPQIFDYVRVLFNANGMKLFLSVGGFEDCLKIQSDLNKLVEWCDRNSLLLNVGKCKVMLCLSFYSFKQVITKLS
jgi:hypothetical protein